ncbi:MAG: DUF3298 and DUF4163 domain-containing protein [Acidobacteriota bacterium]|nr:DUF3298 and DUF4163 domain-containing protein [Acidobacteriota bacterium]
MYKSRIYLSIVLFAAFSCLACAFNAQRGQAKSKLNQPTKIKQNAEESQGVANLPVVGATQQIGNARFKGTVGDSKIEMTLRRERERIEGSYFYQKSGSANQLKLTGKIDESGKFTLQEFDRTGKQTGEFSGTWKNEPNESGVMLEGEWRKSKNSESLVFWASEQMISFSSPAAQINTKTVAESNKPKRFNVNAEYPELVGLPNAAGFNALARKVATEPIAGFKKDMLAQSAEDLKYLPEGMNNFLEINYFVEYADEDLISINFINSLFTGGAHPNHYYSMLTYDLKNGKEIKLADLFKPGAKYLDRIAEYSIADLRSRTDESGESLGLATDIWAEGAAPTAENYEGWNLTKKGLMITFDPYQVGPYAAGPQTVIVPFAKLKDLARADGVLARMAK